MQQSNNNARSRDPVPIYFKEALTNNTKIYLVYPDWTFEQFINALSPMIAIDFGFNAFDLVLVGQEGDENGAVLQPLIDMKIVDLLSQTINIAFYIRRT
jgi:hypothetical protein